MLPWSVIPIADISSRCASASIGAIFAAPSNIEYSVWLCRCTKDREDEPFIGTPVYDRAPTRTRGVAACVLLSCLLTCEARRCLNRCRERPRPAPSGGPRPGRPQGPVGLRGVVRGRGWV